MEDKIAPGFQKEFPGIMAQVLEDLAQMLDIELPIDTTRLEARSIESLYVESKRGVVCCRSIFVRKVNGIGGMLLSESIADALSRAAMMMDPAEEDEVFDFDGFGKEALEEIFNIFVGSWNTISSPDYRLGSATEERACEYYPTSIPFPEAAGVFPHALYFPCELLGATGFVAIFIPIKAVHGREVAGFLPPSSFSRNVAAMLGVAPPASEESAPSPPPIKREGPVRPVVFLDYSGAILPWIKERAGSNTRCVLAERITDSIDPDHPPAATIMVGVDPSVLAELEQLRVVEILPNES